MPTFYRSLSIRPPHSSRLGRPTVAYRDGANIDCFSKSVSPLRPVAYTGIHNARIIFGVTMGSSFSPPKPHVAGSVRGSARGGTSVNATSPVSIASSVGTKRKRGEPKFYAVRVGHNPGVYHSWAECLEQVKGFKKATCEHDWLFYPSSISGFEMC